MARYRVPLEGWASATLEVETDSTDPEEIFEEALMEGVPGICASCAGRGRPFSLEIGDDWEPVSASKDDPTPVVYKLED